jgi:hypothetical protein
MRFLASLGTPLPLAFQTTAEFLLNSGLRKAVREENPNLKNIRALLEEASLWNVRLDTADLEYQIKKTMGRMSSRLREEPANLPLLTLLKEVIDLARSRPFDVGLWLVQNDFFQLMNTDFPTVLKQLEEGDANALPWLEQFVQLGDTLGVQVTDLKKKIAEARAIPSVPEVVEEIFAKRRLPVATYRLQFNKTFTFNDARAIVPYLHQLGICDAYASPIQRARPGSMHGYEQPVVDRCARERAELAVCQPLRHRLAAGEPRPAKQGATPRARGPVRTRAGRGETEAGTRQRRLFPVVLLDTPAARPAHLCEHP